MTRAELARRGAHVAPGIKVRPKKKAREDRQLAWAVRKHIDGHDEPCFLGIFWFLMKEPPEPVRGLRVATFRNREEARVAAECTEGTVVRVEIRVREVPRPKGKK